MADVVSPAALPRALSPEALKAFAHPLRTAMYQYLTAHGAATASQLARHLGESTGQTSYHLRQLERHGLIEDDPDHADSGRQRWWRAVGFSLDPRTANDPAARTAAEVALRSVVAERSSTLQAWFDTIDHPSDWVDAALHLQSTPELTMAELTALAETIAGATNDAVARAKALREAERQSGTPDVELPERRRVRIYLDAFPLASEVTDGPTDRS